MLIFLISFAVRTKNIENKPVVNEHGISSFPINLPSNAFCPDNRPVPKPHFAAVAIQPAAPKPAPAIVQSIYTEGTGSGASITGAPALSRSRHSMVPIPKVPRASGVYGYQPFSLLGGGRRPKEMEKVRESDGDQSGTLGIGLTEKEIDERVSPKFTGSRLADLYEIRYRKPWRQRLRGD